MTRDDANPVPPDDLQTTLRRLHSQLDHLGEVDEETTALLEQIRGDVERLTSEEDEEEDEGIAERIEEAAASFEGDHPVLAGHLRQLIQMLNSMGI